MNTTFGQNKELPKLEELTPTQIFQILDIVEANKGLNLRDRTPLIVSKFNNVPGIASRLEPIYLSGKSLEGPTWWVLNKLNNAYDGQGFLKEFPCGFWQFWGDVYSIGAPHPYSKPLATVNRENVGQFGVLAINGLPDYLVSRIPQKTQEQLLDYARECQIHFARLQYLSDCPKLALARIALQDLRSAADRALRGDDFNNSRWDSLQAAEKLLKVLLIGLGKSPKTKSQRKKRKTHDLITLARIVKDQTGIIVPGAWLGSLRTRATSKRYVLGGTYELAQRDFKNALKISSLVFQKLKHKHVPSEPIFWDRMPEKHTALANEMLLVLNYPGIRKKRSWQDTFVDVYGRPI